ncbi:hypothetical protein GGI15_001589 [Coemansia interrupta]|uniref:Uncharacterized protein n=1 Tax=Coemansia interrupta TaxID=1126814 RepID=A0A9W8HQX2_9FUNG|nr:hypothetical protein GGI15_001589 [Coemansia interrupta]
MGFPHRDRGFEDSKLDYTLYAAAVDVSIVVIALAAFASVFRKAQWLRHRHWIQTNMAPVFGIILFLPLVTTIASQIIWRFRSSEFAYCWIPRHPVYARWVATDGWRTLAFLLLLLGYLRMARHLHTQPQLQISWPADRPAIDSAMASAAAPMGLFSQSVYTASRWARSKMARRPTGLRTSQDSSIYGMRHATLSYASHASKDSGAAPGQTRTYVQLTRSFVSSLVRRFITTDIPSPTIAQSIFDRIASNPHECKGALGACAYCCHEEPGWREEENLGGKGGLRRWYSALAGMLGVRAAGWPLARDGRRQSATYALRRSHTAPVLSSDAMGLGSRLFSRPAAVAHTASVASSDAAHDNTLIMTEYIDPALRRQPADAKPRGSAQTAYADEHLAAKIHGIFGRPPAIPAHAIHRVSIRQHGPALSDASSACSPHDHSVALEEGGCWADAVAKCRGSRHSHPAAGSPRVSRLFVYPLAHMLLWLPMLVYCLASTVVYYQAFEKPRGEEEGGRLWKREADFARLPAGWTDDGHNMGRAWPYFLHFAQGVPASKQLGWMAIVQSLHMLAGAVDAVLFWLTEQ